MVADHELNPGPTATPGPSPLAPSDWRAIVGQLEHELQGQLAALRDGTDAIAGDRNRPVAPEQRTRLRSIAEVCDGLAALTSSYLDLVQLQRFADPPAPVATTIARELGHLDRRFAARAAARSLAWRCILDGDDAPIEAAGPRCREILDQLVANALQFTPPGGAVTITARRLGDDWQVVVADNGPGIPEAALGRAFEPFFRLPTGPSTPQGAGLGLAIARELARLHGGRIDLQSLPGQGTTATLRLPCSVSRPGDRRP